jgi:hypothetical protein
MNPSNRRPQITIVAINKYERSNPQTHDGRSDLNEQVSRKRIVVTKRLHDARKSQLLMAVRRRRQGHARARVW